MIKKKLFLVRFILVLTDKMNWTTRFWTPVVKEGLSISVAVAKIIAIFLQSLLLPAVLQSVS